MSNVVYAKYDMTVVWSGGMSPIAMGEVWDSEAELVNARPDLFSAEPTRVRGRVARPPAGDPDQGDQEAGPSSEVPRADKPRRSGKAAG